MGALTVLVVEDDGLNLSLMRSILLRYGFAVLEASDGSQAISRSESFLGEISAFIADVMLPGMSGVETACTISQTRPEIRILFVSGTPVDLWPNSDHEWLTRLRVGSSTFLPKPFTADRLVTALENVMNVHDPSD